MSVLGGYHMNPLFTIGHSTHDWPFFAVLLRRHGIDVLGDVRSTPYSRYTPQFNREVIGPALALEGIRYVYLGDEFGARRKEAACFVDGKVDYDLVAVTPSFLSGMERLKDGASRFRVALMCAEKDPLECHRTILVARQAAAFTEVRHIRDDGSIETHVEAEARLVRESQLGDADLFASASDRLRDAYLKRAREISYERPGPDIGRPGS